jgi:hypothetical protein
MFFLNKCAVGFDYADTKSNLQVWPGGVSPGQARAWVAGAENLDVISVPLKHQEYDSPTVSVDIAKSTFELAVDTGSTESFLPKSSSLPSECVRLFDKPFTSPYGGGTSTCFVVPNITLGRAKFGCRSIEIGDNNGTLSPASLGVPRMVLDCKNSVLYLPVPANDEMDWHWAIAGTFEWLVFVDQGQLMMDSRDSLEKPVSKLPVISIGGFASKDILAGWQNSGASSLMIKLLSAAKKDNKFQVDNHGHKKALPLMIFGSPNSK